MRRSAISALAVAGGFHDGDWVESKDQDPEGDIRLLQLADVGEGRFRDRSDRWINDETFERLQCSWVKPGDILIARMPDPLGRACRVPEGFGRTITVVDVAVLRCDESRVDPRFATYALNSAETRARLESQQDGATRQRISRKRLGRVQIPSPDLDEQCAIADYLDRETAKIDTLIEEQQRLVELQRERRRAVVERTVVRGIDDGVELVETGVEWLERIPSHWRVLPLSRIGDSGAGSGFPPAMQGRKDLPLPFFKVKHLATADERGVIHTADDTVDEEIAAELRATVFPEGTLVYAKVGAALMLGRIRSLGAAGCIDNNMAALVPFDGFDHRFLYYAMSLVRFDYLVNPGAVPSVSDKNVTAFKLAVPPLAGQRDIAAYLDEQTAKIDELIAETERFIELAQERRAALITAAVTGHIDVRGEAP